MSNEVMKKDTRRYGVAFCQNLGTAITAGN